MTRFLITLAVLCGLLAPAIGRAADVSPPAPVAKLPAIPNLLWNTVETWTGFYAGLNGGGSWSYSRIDFVPAGTSSGGFSVSGVMLGATAGYNHQFGAVVLGLEGDIDWANLSGGSPCPGGVFRCQTQSTWLATLRGRVGYAFDRFLPYLTAGVAAAGLSATVTGGGGGTVTQPGWTLGAGFELPVLERVTAKAEYLYVDLGQFDCGPGCGASPVSVHFNSHIVRAGLNYHF